ncbi:MAG: ribosome-associated protein [Parasphingorhabdus sp.]|jgi:ribosome-associated protein
MPQIRLNQYATIDEREILLIPIRAQGPGGQNVNKVSSALQLRFDIPSSSLPEVWKLRLKTARDRRITSDGTIIIKAQRYRTQEKNRQDAIERLQELILRHVTVDKARKATRPSKASKTRRLDQKTRHSKLKSLRRAPVE